VSKEANDNLLKPIQELELHHFVFLMIKRKAPGLDGFYIDFFQMVWEIIQKDLLEAVGESKKSRAILESLFANFL